MKKTMILFSVLLVIALVAAGTSENVFAKAEKKSCCEVKILVLSKGSPVANCMVTVSGPCGDAAMTGSDGLAKLCVGDCGTLTATASCCGGSVQFTACSQTSATINCP